MIRDNTYEESELPIIMEKRLGVLIRWYLMNPTKLLAEAVVHQLEMLLRHPDCIGYPDCRCAYQKMLIQWRAMT